MAHIEAERQIVAEQAGIRLRKIEKTIYTHRQPIGEVLACVRGKDLGPERAPETGWQPFAVPGFWGGFDQTTWFRMQVRVTPEMAGERVVALIRPGGESLAYVNGVAAQGLDRNRDLLILTESAKEGDTFDIALESVPSCWHDMTQPFEYADVAVMHPLVWDVYWDAKVAYDVWELLPENYAPRQQLLALLDRCLRLIDMNAGEAGRHHNSRPWMGFQMPDKTAYLASLRKAQRALRKGFKDFPQAGDLGTLTMTGHSHIDTAWLWPLRETQRKCGRTFSTVLSLMDRYPEYHFSCSQPAQYVFVKEHHPELYARIKQRVAEGRWEPNGCFWVEPDLNVPSGEALVRQTVYGNRFFRSEFGVHSNVAWVPDTFGYCAALPQILSKAQVEFLVTSKLHWNRYTEFPYTFFRWESPDGSRISVVRPRNYNGRIQPDRLIEQWRQYQQKDRTEEFLFPFGFGDGGGGPTMEMLENGKRLGSFVGVPKTRFGTVSGCVGRMSSQCAPEDLPVYLGEMYFELHRGCQTTQARTKRNNRKSEVLLHDVEFLHSLSAMHGGTYEAAAIQDCWKTVLTNQFHDILPGSSINEVYRQADADYADVFEKAGAMRDRAVAELAEQVDTTGGGTPVLVLNTLSWTRGGIVEVTGLSLPDPCAVVDGEGNPVRFQRVAGDTLLIETADVPALGYAVYRIVPGAPQEEGTSKLNATPKGMENDAVRVRFDAHGRLTSVYDKQARREVVPKGMRANEFQLFEDRPIEWEAWDVDFNFEEKMWTPGRPESIEVIEQGPLRATLRMIYKTGKSTITQDVVLHADSPRVEFRTHVDWWEKRTLLKAAFPVDVRSSYATFESQFTTVERPTHRSSPADRAQFEVPAQRWADLSEGDYGVSLLNDCKYGYDAKDNVLRISLLRSAADPDPLADEGEHEFTYALYPHAWDWRNGVVQEGAELNTPMQAVPVAATPGALPAWGGFAEVGADHVIIDTVKRAEDSDAWILRIYEAYGQRGPATIAFANAPKAVAECDLMEENDEPVTCEDARVQLDIRPYEIRTLKVHF